MASDVPRVPWTRVAGNSCHVNGVVHPLASVRGVHSQGAVTAAVAVVEVGLDVFEDRVGEAIVVESRESSGVAATTYVDEVLDASGLDRSALLERALVPLRQRLG